MAKWRRPQGYDYSFDQEFNTVEERQGVLDNYCAGCSRSESCRANEGLRDAIEKNIPFWHKYFVKITSGTMTEHQVVCKEFDKD